MDEHPPCPGPRCSNRILPTSPVPDFCSMRCAASWRKANIPHDPEAVDHGYGIVKGARYVPIEDRNTGTRPRAVALDWMDARPEPT